MKGRAIPYSAEEMAWLEENRLLPITEYHAAFCERFGRTDASKVNLHSLRKRKGWKTGRTGCFEKGAEPFNKGKKCPPGVGGNHPNARRTQFRKGTMNGRAAERYKPIGTERISEDGYRERKVHDEMPLQSRWQLVHRIEWEEANGPIPEGHALKCLDGNRLNCDPSNWEAVPRALLPRLAGGNRYHRKLAFDDAPAELKPTILAVAKVEHAVKKARAA